MSNPEIREWHHSRKGRIRGVVIHEDETWVQVALVGEHDIHWASITNRLEIGAMQDGEVLTARKSLMTPLIPHTSNTPPRVEAEDAVSAETRPGRDSARPAAVGGGSDE